MKQTMEEIRIAGLQALKDKLGAVGMARFMQQFENGKGDYSKERQAWVDRTSMPELLRQIQSEKSSRKTTRKR